MYGDAICLERAETAQPAETPIPAYISAFSLIKAKEEGLVDCLRAYMGILGLFFHPKSRVAYESEINIAEGLKKRAPSYAESL